MLIRRFAAILAVALPLSACSGAGVQHSPGTSNRTIFAEEIAGSGAETLHQLLERTRPEWLRAGGDPGEGRPLAPVIVYVDARRIGDLQSLGDMPVGDIAAVRFESPLTAASFERPQSFFRKREWLRADDTAAGVLLVNTIGATAAVSKPRVEVTAAISTPSQITQGLRAHFAAQGYRDGIDGEDSRFIRSGPSGLPMAASARVNVSRQWLLEVAVARDEAEANGIVVAWEDASGIVPPELKDVKSNWHQSQEVALFAGFRSDPLRIGVGVARQTMDWTYSSGHCRCMNVQVGQETVTGAAGQLVLAFPPASRVFPEARVNVRHYSSGQIPEYESLPAFDPSGWRMNASLGLGFRF